MGLLNQNIFQNSATPLDQQQVYRAPQYPAQNRVIQYPMAPPVGPMRYGMQLPQASNMSGYLDYYRNYARSYQAPVTLGTDIAGANYQAQLAAKAAAEELALQTNPYAGYGTDSAGNAYSPTNPPPWTYVLP